MFNWLRRMLDIRVENTCQVCDELREQIHYEREQNKELIETITSLVKPTPVLMTTSSGGNQQAIARGLTFSRRKTMMEAADRIAAARVNQSPFAAKPDTDIKAADPKIVEQIAKLEEELGIQEDSNAKQTDLHGEGGSGSDSNSSSIQ